MTVRVMCVCVHIFMRMLCECITVCACMNVYCALVDVSHDHIRFLGRLNLNLWDCGGQEKYLEKYLAERKESVFSNVKVERYRQGVNCRS